MPLFCFIFRHSETNEYVYHPINAFHLIKRAYAWIPKFSKWLPNHILQNYDILNLSKQYLRACHGLADIQEHFDLDPNDMAEGRIITNGRFNKIFAAYTSLDSEDLVNIANEAKNVHYYDASPKWLLAALRKAKQEHKSDIYIQKIR